MNRLKEFITKGRSYLGPARPQKFWLPLATLALALIAVTAILINHNHNKSSRSLASAAAPADVCANNSDFGCYRKELTSITKEQGPEKAFTLVKQQYSSSSYVKSQCHQLTHVIGRAAYAKYGNLSATFTHGDQFCWSGYYHGVMEELSKEKGQQTIAQANDICADLRAKQPNSFYHYNCVHGLGHGFMFILDQNLFSSLSACDNLTNSWERTSCYGGVFMQNIMNEQAPDKSDQTVAELRPNEPMYPCTAVAGQYKYQCYLMQTSYALQTQNYDFARVFQLCSQIEPAYVDTCYQSLGRDASGESISDVEQTKARCLLGPTAEARRFCIHGAALDFVSYFHSDKQAFQLCASVPDLQADCAALVKNYYSTF